MANKSIRINISSEMLEVGRSSYAIDLISSVKAVQVKGSAWEVITSGRSYAVLIRFDKQYYALISSKSQAAIDEIYQEINKAIVLCKKGSRGYSNSLTINANEINQSNSKFASGFTEGSVNLNT